MFKHMIFAQIVKDEQWNSKCVQKPNSLLFLVEREIVQLYQISAAIKQTSQKQNFVDQIVNFRAL